MDPIWLDRERVDREIESVDFSELGYDEGFGVYCLHGERFTGAATQRHPDGKLENIVQYSGGVNNGVTVVWFVSGQMERYSELADGARHGVHIEWAEDGTKLFEERYRDGRLAQ